MLIYVDYHIMQLKSFNVDFTQKSLVDQMVLWQSGVFCCSTSKIVPFKCLKGFLLNYQQFHCFAAFNL